MEQSVAVSWREPDNHVALPHRHQRVPHVSDQRTNENITSSLDAEDILLRKMEGDAYFNGDEAQKLLQEAILTLPEKQRIVFNMRYFQEMSYEKMAEILNTSVGALKASYHYAVKKVELFLKEN